MGQGGVFGVEFDAEPISGQLSGNEGSRARAQERIKHEARQPSGLAEAVGAQLGGVGPWAPTGTTDTFGTSRLQRPFYEGSWEGGEVLAGELGRRDQPDVAWIAAEGM